MCQATTVPFEASFASTNSWSVCPLVVFTKQQPESNAAVVNTKRSGCKVLKSTHANARPLFTSHNVKVFAALTCPIKAALGVWPKQASNDESSEKHAATGMLCGNSVRQTLASSPATTELKSYSAMRRSTSTQHTNEPSLLCSK